MPREPERFIDFDLDDDEPEQPPVAAAADDDEDDVELHGQFFNSPSK